ncbi:MAG: preprotein translocase subunit SecG [Bacteroidia bacterium]|nr:preprotein translocase subunit SecG [Bacteroidia bacterium]
MVTAISIIIFLSCILLVVAVLIQNPKGGGLASGFQSGAQVMGVRRTADFLEKATWFLAILILVLSILATSLSDGTGSSEGSSSATKDKASEMGTEQPAAPGPQAMPGGGAPTPPAGQ